MSTTENGMGNDHGGGADVLFRLLHAHGFEKRSAWIQLNHGASGKMPPGDGANGGAPPDDRPKSRQAKAKAKQRHEDRKNGWAECYAKAPDDDDARRLIAEIGKAIKDPRTRKAIRIALNDPRTALLGKKALAKRGFRWRIAHAVLGSWRR